MLFRAISQYNNIVFGNKVNINKRALARYEISVNAVASGFIETGLLTCILNKIEEKILDQTPLRCFGRPEEVAETVIFLLSNDFITGEVINVDGGLWSHMP